MLSSWWSRTPKLLVFAGLLAIAFAVTASNPIAVTANIGSNDFYPGPCTSAPKDVVISYFGAVSGCTNTNGIACQPGEVITFEAKSSTYNFAVCDQFTWNFGDGTTATTLWPSITRQFTGSNARTVRLSVANSFASAGVSGGTVAVPPSVTTSCVANANTLCFVNGRYMVTLDAADVPARSNKTATGEANVQTSDTGYFTLSGLTGSTANPEVVVKVLEVPASFVPAGYPPSWVFFGGLTDLEYFVNVLDTTTGKVRQYHKFPGTVQNGFDTGTGQQPTIETAPAQICPQTPTVTTSTVAPGACVAGANALCLLGNRFKVELLATNRNPGADAGKQAPGVTLPKNDLFGFFSIPGLTGNPNNLEAFVKILDARALGGKFWVFFGTLTNFELDLSITDTTTGQKRTYKRSGTGNSSACGAADTAAFPF
jgi:hypothetical protein